jgi:endonuclease G
VSNRRRSVQSNRLLWLVVFVVAVALYFLIPDEQPVDEPAPLPSSAASAPTRQRPQSQSSGVPGGERSTTNTNAALGNPSGATPDVANANNYLIEREQYVLSYNRDGGIPNWVSWHLSAADFGDVDRSEFQPDTSLPDGWYQVRPSDYTNSGYDRGHMAPSADRTVTVEDNEALFLMTNIVPQAPDNNQGPWVQLEEWCRDQARAGNELYITSGVNGTQEILPKGEVRVPESVWKVVVVLPEGEDDLNRIGGQTEIIAIDMPNQQGIRDTDWQQYLVSVDEIEQTTGYDFLRNIDPGIQAQLEASVAAP